MNTAGMHLKILLPFRVFAEHDGVSRIVAETADGFFGILPRRLDGVAALVPAYELAHKESQLEELPRTLASLM